VALNDAIMVFAFAPHRRPAARPVGDHGAVGHAAALGRCSTSSCRSIIAQICAPRCWRRRPGARRGCWRASALVARALLATLVLLFGFQGEQIIAQPLVIALLAVPILIQVYFNSGLAYC
jgi:ACR3 family arsenite transporter